jgi:hypothetical protein
MNGRAGWALLLLAFFALAKSWGLFAAMLAVAVIWWLVRLRRHPFGGCYACKGRRGRNRGSDDGQWGRCPVCGGSGERVRFGARSVRHDLRR